jgi:hypothetical protein
MYDVVLLAHHFGVSRSAALYRLRNLRLINASDLDALQEQDRRGLGHDVAELLGLPEPDHREARREFRRRFLALAIEAFRREEITRAKLRELAGMVDVAGGELDEVIVQAGLGEQDGNG